MLTALHIFPYKDQETIRGLLFEEKKGFKFSTYAYGGFEMCRRDIIINKNISYKRNNFSTQEHVETVFDQYPLVRQSISTETLFDVIDKAELAFQEKECIEEYFIESKTMDKIAAEFAVSRARVSQVIQGALRKIRKVAERERLCLSDFY